MILAWDCPFNINSYSVAVWGQHSSAVNKNKLAEEHNLVYFRRSQGVAIA